MLLHDRDVDANGSSTNHNAVATFDSLGEYQTYETKPDFNHEQVNKGTANCTFTNIQDTDMETGENLNNIDLSNDNIYVNLDGKILEDDSDVHEAKVGQKLHGPADGLTLMLL